MENQENYDISYFMKKFMIDIKFDKKMSNYI